MKSKNPSAIIYYLCAVVFYVLAATKFFHDDHSMGVVWMCTGTTFLCLGTMMSRRSAEKDDDPDSRDDDNDSREKADQEDP